MASFGTLPTVVLVELYTFLDAFSLRELVCSSKRFFQEDIKKLHVQRMQRIYIHELCEANTKLYQSFLPRKRSITDLESHGENVESHLRVLVRQTNMIKLWHSMGTAKKNRRTKYRRR